MGFRSSGSKGGGLESWQSRAGFGLIHRETRDRICGGGCSWSGIALFGGHLDIIHTPEPPVSRSGISETELRLGEAAHSIDWDHMFGVDRSVLRVWFELVGPDRS